MKKSKITSSRSSALIAGISLLLMAVVAGLTYGYLHSRLVIADDAESTLNNLRAFPDLFKEEIFGWVVVFFLDGMAAWALYHFFEPVSIALSFLSSFLRAVYTAALGIAIFNLPKILDVVNGQLSHLGMAKESSLIMEYFGSFEDLWSKGLIIFGLHLLLLGYLAFTAKNVPKVWGVLLMIAGLSYTYLHAFHTLLPLRVVNLNLIEAILSIPMILGEVGFAIWLVAKGGKKEGLPSHAAVYSR